MEFQSKSRFVGFSEAIDMEKLEKETQRLFYLGLLFSVSLWAAAASFFIYRKSEVKVVKPPTMELVIRRPRMTKAFEFKKQRVAQRVYQKREIQQRKPSAEIQTKSINTNEMLGSVATFEYKTDMNTNIDQGFAIPQINIEMTTTREPDKSISMKEEMISLDDLDTGQYKAMVIQDPNNKQSIKGFVYIATSWGSQLRPPDVLKRSVINLVEAVNRYTNINAKADTHLFLDSRKIFETPFVYITTADAFELTEIEKRNFGDYLRKGGFAVVDNGTPQYEFGQAEAALRQMLREALGNDAKFVPIPIDHPLYHCYFDFDGPPQGSEMVPSSTATVNIQGWTALTTVYTKQVLYLEGIWIDNRLVAVYSDKGYGKNWSLMTDNDAQLRIGVNMVVFALTQAGGIAQQKMDVFSSVQ